MHKSASLSHCQQNRNQERGEIFNVNNGGTTKLWDNQRTKIPFALTGSLPIFLYLLLQHR